jgi:anti-sigma B factor antagonist
MDITITEHIQRTVTIVVKDRLDVMTAPELKAQIEKYLEEGVIHFIVDLFETPFMDSAGMAVLVTLLRRCRMKNGSVKLVWPQAQAVQRTLMLTRFDQVFEVVGKSADRA